MELLDTSRVPFKSFYHPHTKFESKQVFGITKELYWSGEGNYLRVNFYICKHNIAKYVHKLLMDLPDLEPGQLTVNVSRNNVYDAEDRLGLFSSGSREKHLYTKAKRTKRKRGNKFLYREYIGFNYEIPMLFSLDVNFVMDKVIELRYIAEKLLASYKAIDDLNLIQGKPVTEEYNQEELNNLTYIDRELDNKYGSINGKEFEKIFKYEP